MIKWYLLPNELKKGVWIEGSLALLFLGSHYYVKTMPQERLVPPLLYLPLIPVWILLFQLWVLWCICKPVLMYPLPFINSAKTHMWNSLVIRNLSSKCLSWWYTISLATGLKLLILVVIRLWIWFGVGKKGGNTVRFNGWRGSRASGRKKSHMVILFMSCWQIPLYVMLILHLCSCCMHAGMFVCMFAYVCFRFCFLFRMLGVLVCWLFCASCSVQLRTRNWRHSPTTWALMLNTHDSDHVWRDFLNN